MDASPDTVYYLATAWWPRVPYRVCLLVFGLLAISLVWSAGQRLDVWAFLFFNLRGARPVWLDKMMLGFTQIGSGISGRWLVLYLSGSACWRTSLFWGLSRCGLL